MENDDPKKTFTGVHCNYTAFEHRGIPAQECRIILNNTKTISLPISEESDSFIIRFSRYKGITSHIIVDEYTQKIPADKESPLLIYPDIDFLPLSSSPNDPYSYLWSSASRSPSQISFCSLHNCVSPPLPSPHPKKFYVVPFTPSSPPTNPANLLYINNLPHTIQFFHSLLITSPPLSSPLPSPLPSLLYIKHKDEPTDFSSSSPLPETSPPDSPFQVFSPQQLFSSSKHEGTLVVNHQIFQPRKDADFILKTFNHHYVLRLSEGPERHLHMDSLSEWRDARMKRLQFLGEEEKAEEGDEETQEGNEDSKKESKTVDPALPGKEEAETQGAKPLLTSPEAPAEPLPKGEDKSGGKGLKSPLLHKQTNPPLGAAQTLLDGGTKGGGEAKSFWEKNGGKMGGLCCVLVLLFIVLLYFLRRRPKKKQALLDTREERSLTQYPV